MTQLQSQSWHRSLKTSEISMRSCCSRLLTDREQAPKHGRIGRNHLYGNCMMPLRSICWIENRSTKKPRSNEKLWKQTITSISRTDYAEEIEAHFELMPDDYFERSEVAEIVDRSSNYFGTFLKMFQTNPIKPLAPAINWQPFARARSHDRHRFCTWDRDRLLAKSRARFQLFR